jgi:ubiquitin carboxyl-terminal hydrolase 40
MCQKKTLSLKGPRISRLPPVLTFCLNRIELDFETWDRKKINDKFEYPLELDMANYVDLSPEEISAEQVKDPDQTIYELKSIVIHRGGPYGGHYHAYIRDDLHDGNWDLELPEKFEEHPTEVKS